MNTYANEQTCLTAHFELSAGAERDDVIVAARVPSTSWTESPHIDLYSVSGCRHKKFGERIYPKIEREARTISDAV